jgi:hypothetical protein
MGVIQRVSRQMRTSISQLLKFIIEYLLVADLSLMKLSCGVHQPQFDNLEQRLRTTGPEEQSHFLVLASVRGLSYLCVIAYNYPTQDLVDRTTFVILLLNFVHRALHSPEELDAH